MKALNATIMKNVGKHIVNDKLYARVRHSVSQMEKELDRICEELHPQTQDYSPLDDEQIHDQKIQDGMQLNGYQIHDEKMNNDNPTSEILRMKSDLRRILLVGGKRLRPILSFLCYNIGVEYAINEANDSVECAEFAKGTKVRENKEITPLMCMLELMHTASLVHDDIVDDAKVRRNNETINSSSGDAAAIRCGDYLMAKAMEQLKHYHGTGINEELAEVSAEMCRGELNQLALRNNWLAQNEHNYYLCIRRKTAGLIAASCYCGALAAGMSKDEANALKLFGDRFGMAFQIRDDIMDFSASYADGKATGQDIKNGIFTLPVILAKPEFTDEISTLLEKNEKTIEEEKRIIEFVKRTDAIKHSKSRIRVLCEEAISSLDSFKGSIYKDALIKMVNTL